MKAAPPGLGLGAGPRPWLLGGDGGGDPERQQHRRPPRQVLQLRHSLLETEGSRRGDADASPAILAINELRHRLIRYSPVIHGNLIALLFKSIPCTPFHWLVSGHFTFHRTPNPTLAQLTFAELFGPGILFLFALLGVLKILSSREARAPGLAYPLCQRVALKFAVSCLVVLSNRPRRQLHPYNHPGDIRDVPAYRYLSVSTFFITQLPAERFASLQPLRISPTIEGRPLSCPALLSFARRWPWSRVREPAGGGSTGGAGRGAVGNKA